MFDCHVHTSFSADSDAKPEIMIEAALKKGLKGLAVTDHLDYDYPDFEDLFMVDFDCYDETLNSLKDYYKEKIKVIKGIEVGIQPSVIGRTKKLVGSYKFDFVICSVHIIDGQDPYTGKYYIDKTRYDAFYRYLECILDSVEKYDDYDIIGHIGYIRRYGEIDDRSMTFKEFPEIIDEILKKVIAKGKGIEINSSGLRTGLDTPIPDYDILKRYKELGGEILTIGSDAHYPEHIASEFSQIVPKLRKNGFKYAAYYENRKPFFYKI